MPCWNTNHMAELWRRDSVDKSEPALALDSSHSRKEASFTEEAKS